MGWDVFISYASEDRVKAATPLKEALEAAGLSVWIDKEQVKIGEGFRRSIDVGLGHSKHGVVILSPRFFAKPWPQQELDAIFERHVNSGRRVLIPVVLDMTADEIRTHSSLLAGMKLLFVKDGLQSVVQDIISHVAGTPPPEPQPASVEKSDLPAAMDLERLVFVTLADGKQFFIQSSSVSATASSINAYLRPSNPAESESLSHVKMGSHVAITFGMNCLVGRVDAVKQDWEGTDEEWHLELRREDSLLSPGTEVNFAGTSPDAIAEMRARRVLLNEKLPTKPGTATQDLNNLMLELHVRGQHGSFLSVTESPLPRLYEKLSTQEELFLATAKLASVATLVLSKTVERIRKLKFSMTKGGLAVEFEGVRAKVYSNVEPTKLVVTGKLRLA